MFPDMGSEGFIQSLPLNHRVILAGITPCLGFSISKNDFETCPSGKDY